jgi:hypothetical protein
MNGCLVAKETVQDNSHGLAFARVLLLHSVTRIASLLLIEIRAYSPSFLFLLDNCVFPYRQVQLVWAGQGRACSSCSTT